MKNLYTIIAFALIALLSLIPPIDFVISNPFNDKWFLLILICGFAGFYTLFLDLNWAVRAIAVLSFFNCFFSASPLVSFTAYISIILCCYFYFICTKIEDWKPIFQMLQTILFLNVFLMFMQAIGKDTLLNWGEVGIEHFGIVGQHMQMASFTVILCAFLVLFNPLNFIFAILIAIFCNSIWGIVPAAAGIGIYLFKKSKKAAIIFIAISTAFFVFTGIQHGKFSQNIKENGRFNTWVRSVEAANQRPVFGWGPGTYKFIYPQITPNRNKNIPYKTAHNFIVQLLFETGYPGALLILGLLGAFAYTLIRNEQVLLLSGLVMIFLDALVHFPDRQIHCVLIIIAFFAYCERQIKHGYLIL